MWATIFWVVLVIAVIGLLWYFLKQKKGKGPTIKTEEKPGIPFSETPSETPPTVPPPDETLPPEPPQV